MFQGDVQILLTIKVGGIAADPTLQPVIMAVVARQPRKSIVILRLRGGNAGGHHRFPVVRQRLLRRPALGGKARSIAQHQRALHRGRLRLRLRHNLIKNPLRVSGIAKASSRQRHPPLHVHGFGLCAFQLHDLRPGGRFIALGQVDFRKAEARIAVVGLLTQHPLIVGNRRLAVAALLRPVGQRQIIAHRGGLPFDEGDRLRFVAAVAQLVGLAQHPVALQARFEFTNVIRPRAARQSGDLRQSQIVLVVPRQVESRGVDPFGVLRLAVDHRPHQRVGLLAFASADQIPRQTVGYPDAVRIQRQAPTLNFRRLRPVALALQSLRLFLQPVVSQAALNIIDTAPLSGREAGDPGAGFLRRFGAIEVGQAAHRQVIAAIQAQRLLVIALRRRLFARRRDIPQPQHGIAVGAIDPLRLGIIVLRLRKLAGFQGVIPLLYQQPVAVSLQQAVPLAAVRAVRVHGNRFTELRHCPRAVAALGIGLAESAHRVAVAAVGLNGFLQIRDRLRGIPGLDRRQPFRAGAESRILQLRLLLVEQNAGVRRHRAGGKLQKKLLQRLHAGLAHRHAFHLTEPHIGGDTASRGRSGHLRQIGEPLLQFVIGEHLLRQRSQQADVARRAGVQFFQLADAFAMAGRQARHQRPVFNGDVNVIRHPAVQFFIGGDGFIDLPGHAQQSRLLQRLAALAGVAFHLIARRLQLRGVRRQLRQSFQLFLRPGGIPLTQQIAHPRGNQLRVVGINQLQTVQRLAHQVFTIAGLAEADLLQQMLLGRRRRRLR
ncbi:hypothetical protein H216_2199 [Klebsiella pneumoniae DMC0526]|nr:hypothetical protein H216_2199 [Klebsiella pneumoniae DMC0526]